MVDLTPSEFYLSQNYPNPFSDKTTIKFCVAYKGKVKLEIFIIMFLEQYILVVLLMASYI